jgi:thiamine-phosphate pyrophosphorylase
MAESNPIRTRLCLVTPPLREPRALAAMLSDALAGGDVASLIVSAGPASPEALQQIADLAVPIAQKRGVAAFVADDTRVAGRVRADGIHVDTGLADVKAAVARFHPKQMVGAGGAATRDEAMALGEAGADYLFFGRLDGDSGATIFARALDQASWWSAVTTVPAIVMGGNAIASVTEAAQAGIEFVALSRAIWDHPGGAGSAVAEACATLASAGREAVS